jgi:hypothetical protein
MPRTGLRGGAYEVASYVVVALPAARTVDDDVGSIHRGLDSLATRKVASNEFDALTAVAAAPAEDSYVISCVLQPRNDQPSERACATGHQCFHICFSLSHTRGMGCHVL